MTKEQKSNYLRKHGITVVGFKARDQYIVKQVGEQQFGRHEQRAAHLALIEAFLEVVRKETAEE